MQTFNAKEDVERIKVKVKLKFLHWRIDWEEYGRNFFENWTIWFFWLRDQHKRYFIQKSNCKKFQLWVCLRKERNQTEMEECIPIRNSSSSKTEHWSQTCRHINKSLKAISSTEFLGSFSSWRNQIWVGRTIREILKSSKFELGRYCGNYHWWGCY